MKPEWLVLTAQDLHFERQQLIDEGKDISPLEDEFDSLIAKLEKRETDAEDIQDRVDVVDSAVASETSVELHAESGQLLDKARTLPDRSGYPYEEPSELKGIRAERPDGPRQLSTDRGESVLTDHIHGAWLGRCAGCLLGKPVEGWTRDRLRSFLTAVDAFPLEGYVRSDVSQSVLEDHDIDPDGIFSSCIDRVDHMIEDDDTNYTVAGLELLSQDGAAFTSDDVAGFWMRNIPMLRVMTAERIAYRNFATLVGPPESARHRNPCREWIGAQIRADPYGYVALGNPELAAEFAWRDARVSHVKNGIYGSMWVAAMIAAAPYLETIEDVVRLGLTEIPGQSRLAEVIEDVLAWRQEGIDYQAAVDRIHDRWDETYYHHWCHTISNAAIVVASLLWSDGEVGTTICRAVQAGFDTDSNGATVGSISGMFSGADTISTQWTDPLNDTIETGIDGYQLVSISDLATETLEVSRSL